MARSAVARECEHNHVLGQCCGDLDDSSVTAYSVLYLFEMQFEPRGCGSSHLRGGSNAHSAFIARRALYMLGTAMTVTQLDKAGLDRYLGLSGWNEPVSTEPLPGPSLDDAAWSRQAELDRIRASVRTALARSSGMSIDVPFTLRKPACIAAVMGRARAEQYAVLCEICDILRGDHSIKIIAGFEDEAIWNAAIAATRRVRHLSEFDPYTLDRASRPRAVGEACGRLEKRGFTIMALV
jgi:hypothetical protein